jgi:DNA polymerase-1
MNIQTIPREDKVIKEVFVPKLDAFLSADYPNIELKLLAFYLEKIGAPSMAEVFRNGADLHKETAAGLYGVKVDDVTDAQRQIGKRLNFSIVYGGGIPTLIKQGVAADAKEALNLLSRFHKTWPAIGWESKRKAADKGTLIDTIKRKIEARRTATEPGYITTLWGRHLHPHSTHVMVNCLCQGGGADLMKWALIRVHRYTRGKDMVSHLVNSVHDELMLDCAAHELQHLTVKVPQLMTYTMINDVVPIVPEPEVSFTSWADKKEFDPLDLLEVSA